MDKTLQITFYQGETNGIKILEFSKGDIIWFFIPKILFTSDLLKSDYFKDALVNTGVYFLLGEKTYIGQAINIFERLKWHIREGKKEFKDMVCFTTSNNSFDEWDINYLEKTIIGLAKENNNLSLMNLSIGNNTNIKNYRKSDLSIYLDEIKFILNILALNFLEKTRGENTSHEQMFCIDSKETKAQLQISEKWYVVLAGSYGNDNEQDSMLQSYKNLRNELLESWVIEKRDGKIYFLQDHIFTSSTAPAQILLWYSVSGPQKWKNENKMTLWEYEKSKIIDLNYTYDNTSIPLTK